MPAVKKNWRDSSVSTNGNHLTTNVPGGDLLGATVYIIDASCDGDIVMTGRLYDGSTFIPLVDENGVKVERLAAATPAEGSMFVLSCLVEEFRFEMANRTTGQYDVQVAQRENY
jgi:hypothetical protein